MSFGIQSVTTSLNELNYVRESRVERQRIESTNDYGGLKLEKSTPQPRQDRPEPAPELKELRELRPYIANGQTVVPKPELEYYDPEGPLTQLLTTVDGLRDSKNLDDRLLFTRCERALRDIKDGLSLLKSPPEYDTREYAKELKAQVELLKDMSDVFAKGYGSEVMIGGTNGDVAIGTRIKQMLDETAKELEDYSNYVGDKPDPRPNMQSVGHFKSFETRGAIRTLDHYIDTKRNEVLGRLHGLPGMPQLLDTFLGQTNEQIGNNYPLDNEAFAALDGLRLLLLTKDDLENRLVHFEGGGSEQFRSTEPLDKEGLTEAMGKKKPGFFEKMFKFLGLSTFARAMNGMDREIREHRMPPLNNPYMSEGKMMAKLLSARLKEAGFEDISQKDLSHEMERNHVKSLSEDQNWDIIEKEMHLVIDGQNRSFTSTLTPHNQLGTGHAPGEGKGVCCHDGTSGIPVNMWQSELKDEDGNVLFSQLRTGVNCAYEIENPLQRKIANLGRARDMFDTHLKTHPGVQEQLKEGLGTEDKPIVLRNLWVSHLTPDAFRPVFKGQNENELMMSREQNEAMQTLKGVRRVTIEVEGQQRNVYVDYQPIMFSMGVNVGAVGGLNFAFGGWGTANPEFNEPSMEVLLGRDGMKGGEFGGWVKDGIDSNNGRILQARNELDEIAITDNDTDVERQQKEQLIQELEQRISDLEASNERIEALAQQVQEIWSSGDFKSSGEDPYKMSSRLGVLGYELGCAITSNCKSNKDRNSYGDVHMKDLSIQMHTKGEIRGPNEPRSREEELNLRTLTRESGNHELQKLNVGGAGYKLEKVDRVFQAQGLEINDLGFYGFGQYTAT
jgi:hypothetical protein